MRNSSRGVDGTAGAAGNGIVAGVRNHVSAAGIPERHRCVPARVVRPRPAPTLGGRIAAGRRPHTSARAHHSDAMSEAVAVCGRCGKPAEAGTVTGSGGWFGFAGMARIGWQPRPATRWQRLTSAGEVLAGALVGPARTPAHRCRTCRRVWFDY